MEDEDTIEGAIAKAKRVMAEFDESKVQLEKVKEQYALWKGIGPLDGTEIVISKQPDGKFEIIESVSPLLRNENVQKDRLDSRRRWYYKDLALPTIEEIAKLYRVARIVEKAGSASNHFYQHNGNGSNNSNAKSFKTYFN